MELDYQLDFKKSVDILCYPITPRIRPITYMNMALHLSIVIRKEDAHFISIMV